MLVDRGGDRISGAIRAHCLVPKLLGSAVRCLHVKLDVVDSLDVLCEVGGGVSLRMGFEVPAAKVAIADTRKGVVSDGLRYRGGLATCLGSQ